MSWAHGDERWERTIAAFAWRLRELGVDADVDLFHLDEQAVNWTTYGPQAIEDSDVVLIAGSAAYKLRWEGRNDPTQGAGAAREANVLKTLFEDDQSVFLRKVKVVVLPGARMQDIPSELCSATQRFVVESIDAPGLESLLRNLTGQARLPINPLGPVPVLAPTLLDHMPPPEREARRPTVATGRRVREFLTTRAGLLTGSRSSSRQLSGC